MCDSVAAYGATPGYVEANLSMVANVTMGVRWGADMVHISNMSVCTHAGHMHAGDIGH